MLWKPGMATGVARKQVFFGAGPKELLLILLVRDLFPDNLVDALRGWPSLAVLFFALAS